MQTVYGQLLDDCGFSLTTQLVQGAHGPVLEKRAEALPAGGLRGCQPQRIPVEAGHGGAVVGEAVYVERMGRHVWLVAHVDDDIVPMTNVRVADRLVQVE